MEGSAITLQSLLQSKSLEVPFFQRPYVWEEEHFEALIDSIDDSPNSSMPFFGSVILQELGDTDSGHYLVIDGQQRCTTFSILIRSILDVCINCNILSATQSTRLIDCIYSVSESDDGEEIYTPRLIPSNPDKKSFEKVLDNNTPRPIIIDPESSDSIDRAYLYFYEYFKNNNGKIKPFYTKIVAENKSLIKITLTKSDDEQKIFDSVNSMGKALSNADIIKNFIFQKLRENAKQDVNKQNDVTTLYEKYWDNVFYSDSKKEFWDKEFTVGRIKTDNLECFLKDFAIIKKIYSAKKTTGTYGLCNAYKAYVNGLSDADLKKFVKDISDYANTFYKYKNDFEQLNEFRWSDHVNRLILILTSLDTTTFNPYVLMVLKQKPNETENRFFNLEKFLLQRFIFDGTTKNYNQCCEKLIQVDDDKKYLSDYMKDSPPSNDSYKPCFRKLNNNQARLILFMLEMLYRNGEEDKYSDSLVINKYSLEHIMPQKWQNAWYNVESYDENSNIINRNDVDSFMYNRNKAVKSLGNMTLLTGKLNTSISNSSFEVKMEGRTTGTNSGGIKKYASSLITTNKIISIYENQKAWDERNIYSFESQYFEKLNEFYKFV